MRQTEVTWTMKVMFSFKLLSRRTKERLHQTYVVHMRVIRGLSLREMKKNNTVLKGKY